MSSEMMAQLMIWAIFGAALAWSREPNLMPADQMANQIVGMLMDGVLKLMPDLSSSDAS